MNKWLVSSLLAVSLASAVWAQDNAARTMGKDLDPLALQALKTATEPIKDAKAFSFRILTSRDLVGTNDQIITQFSVSEITVQRPNKLHITFRGRGEPVELFYDGTGKTVLYSPSVKLYTTIATSTTIDGMLSAAEQRGMFIAVRNLLESDPYKSLTDDLTTAYIVGKTSLFDQEVHHLAFTEAGAEWQMWILSGDKPTVRRLEVINQEDPHHPRVVVDFMDWNFNASPSADMFTFNKPSDAREIEMLKITAEK
jgi:hypothetical protein